MTSKLIVNSIRHTGASADGITLDSSGNVTFPANATCSGTATGFGAITMADQWRLTSNFANSGASVINANWERVDNTYWSKIGAGMSESSGIFSFPATGIYFIELVARGTSDSGARSYAGAFIHTGVSGTYTNVSDSYDNCAASGYYFNAKCSTFFDVTNTSTYTVRFNAESSASCNYSGNTNQSQTHVTFLRLGDT